MKALTIWQPWASLILSGHKTVENRSWTTRHRGPLAIHAAARIPTPIDLPIGVVLPAPLLELPRGVVLGTVEILDCVPLDDWLADHPGDPWAFGPWCWVLGSPTPFKRPIPARGLQALWTWRP